MASKKGSYSKIIAYDERKRYYYLHPQKNKPILDDEIRSIGLGLIDQIRRNIQSSYGEVAVPYTEYSSDITTREAFRVIEDGSDKSNNFVVKGGNGTTYPAVLYAKGFYIFLTEDIKYNDQEYGPDTDLADEDDKSKTITEIPSLNTPTEDRTDIVYVSFHFKEVSSVEGDDQEVYLDSDIRNPVVGTDTSNRLRAVIDIKVIEDWKEGINKNIFDRPEFLGDSNLDDKNPIDNEYRIPIAVIKRKSYQSEISNDQIIDLLELYDKRVLTPNEVSFRLSHGGYTERDVNEKDLEGFTPQYPNAELNETALGSGPDKGIKTESFNTNSVTPRIIYKDGKFLIDALIVGNETPSELDEKNPELLNKGEVISKEISSQSVYIGHGADGLESVEETREYKDKANIVIKGTKDGGAGLRIQNIDGEEDSETVTIMAKHDGEVDNFLHIDHMGRVGLNTLNPGGATIDEDWNTDRYIDTVNIVLDVDDSVKIRKHLFVEKDAYIGRDLFGKSFRIPKDISCDTPVMLGFEGVPQKRPENINDSLAKTFIKKGVAIVGEEGTEAHGYTGQFGYEAFTEDGQRVFTIGDLGEEYDRVVKTMYGIGLRGALLSDHSFMSLPYGYNTLQEGDVIHYEIILAGNVSIGGDLTLTQSGIDALLEIRSHILNNEGFPDGGSTSGYRYARDFEYEYYNEDGTTETKNGTAFGAMALDEHPNDEISYGKLVIKSITEEPLGVRIDRIESFTVSRDTLDGPIEVSFTPFTMYGSTDYGGSKLDLKFAKLDLGEAVDAWLFNGDVFFNGGGRHNKTVFSPNAIFKNDVFVYGNLFSNTHILNSLSSSNLHARVKLKVDKNADISGALTVGPRAFEDYKIRIQDDKDITFLNRGKSFLEDVVIHGRSNKDNLSGSLRFSSSSLKKNAYAYIGGVFGNPDNPFGLHMRDMRPNIDPEDRLREFNIRFSTEHVDNDRRGVLRVGGDIVSEGLNNSRYLTVGDDVDLDTNYRAFINGRTRINGTLEVDALRFVSSESPDGSGDLIDPSNISITGRVFSDDTDRRGEQNINVEHILRRKDFSCNKRLYLNNQSSLSGSLEDARWAKDTLSYSESDINQIIGRRGTYIRVDDIEDDTFKKYFCERINVANLGRITITWDGFVENDYEDFSDIYKIINSYTFTSNYFRAGEGGTTSSTFNWSADDREGDDNLIMNIESNIINTESSSTPTIYNIKRALSIHIPMEHWKFVKSSSDSGRYSYSLYYQYEDVIDNYNISDFKKNGEASQDSSDPGWKVALFPRLFDQRREFYGNDGKKRYIGNWDLYAIILPEKAGDVANLTGNMYISYFQS